MNLFINYFDHESKQRAKEIDYCLGRNEENPFIKTIHIINRNSTATYGEFFQAMMQYPDDVNIVANADIYFDHTIEKVETISKNQCYALTRWELFNGRVIPFMARHGRRVPVQWTQDAWIFRGGPNPTGFDTVKAVNLDTKKSEIIPFRLGIAGCDNKLVALLREKQWQVTNPSLNVRAIHVHQDDGRSYPPYQILAGIRPNGLVYQTSL